MNCNIGIIMGNLDAPHAFELASGITHAAKSFDANLLFFPGMYAKSFYKTSMLDKRAEYDYQNTAIFDFIDENDCDILIISMGTVRTFLDDNEWNHFLEKYKGTPCIILEDIIAGYPSITINNESGFRECVRHLVEVHGYKKIGYVGGSEFNYDAKERFRVYKEVLHEYSIEVKDKLIAHGNFTEYTDALVGRLLDDNPDLEAIVFANDMMALGGYREIERRGLRVGKDIAVTGFDDYILSMSMEPPLTTVRVSAYQLGFTAVSQAILALRGEKMEHMEIPTKLIVRGSCGCQNEGLRLLEQGENFDISDVDKFIHRMVDGIMSHMSNKVVYHSAHDVVGEFVLNIMAFVNNKKDVLPSDECFLNPIKELLGPEYVEYIAIDKLYISLNQFMQAVLKKVRSESKKNDIVTILSNIYAYISNFVTNDFYRNNTRFKKDSWYATFITRDTMVYSADEREALYQIILKLQGLQFQSAYIFLFKEPIINHNRADRITDSEMYLAAYFNKTGVVAFEPEDRSSITIGEALKENRCDDNRYTVVNFLLFANEEQYGILTCEVELKEFSFAYTISLQIGSALKFLYLMRKQMQMQKQLEGSLQIISRKNDLLSHLSISDELTGLLNRRGLFEEICHKMDECQGQLAVMVFIDMDNLKGINDNFGHTEGDYAIRNIAEILKKSFRNEDAIGRIGGDEFAAFAIVNEVGMVQGIRRNIEKYTEELNRLSGKPYYMEVSYGIEEFVCHKELILNDILKQADVVLYEDKKNKRKSCIKEEIKG